MSKKIVSLDSQIFIWGIKKHASADQNEMIAIAKSFLKYLDDEQYQVVVPSPVLSELLIRIPPEKDAAFVELMQSQFAIAPFDTLAATKCAEMMRNYKSSEELQQYRKDHKITNATIKYDHQIVAISCVRDCKCIYSYDKGLKNFADGYIEVKEMPNFGAQTDIFDDV